MVSYGDGNVGNVFPEASDTSFIPFCQCHHVPFAIGSYFAPFLPFVHYHTLLRHFPYFYS